MFLFTNLIMATLTHFDAIDRYASGCNVRHVIYSRSTANLLYRHERLDFDPHGTRTVGKSRVRLSLCRRLQVPHTTIRPTPQPAWSLWHFYNTPYEY